MLYIEQPAGTGFSTGSDADLYGEVPLADGKSSSLNLPLPVSISDCPRL
jgi:hypothetical protein